MAIKLIPLTKAFPNSGYNTNKKRSVFFLYAGVAYLQAYEELHKQAEGFIIMYVELPLLHMALELLIKAHAARINESFNPKDKKYQHQSINILKEYANKVSEFKSIIDDPKKADLIKKLEKAWKSLRYGETALFFDGKDMLLAKDLAFELAEAYHKATKIPFFSHHFPTKK